MSEGWIGVDLDGTLAHYQHMEKWDGSIGEPVPLMLERVKRWLAEGKDVRIVTARVSSVDGVTDGPREVEEQRRRVADWLVAHVGRELPVTSAKDYHMRELWDDRAVQVEKNTGRRIDGVTEMVHYKLISSYGAHAGDGQLPTDGIPREIYVTTHGEPTRTFELERKVDGCYIYVER